MKLTEPILNQLGISEFNMEFMRRNDLIGIPFSRVAEIQGDFQANLRSLKIIQDIQLDKSGRVSVIKYNYSETCHLAYNYEGFVQSRRRENGKFENFEYDSEGNLIKYFGSDLSSRQMWYDNDSNLVFMSRGSDDWIKYDLDEEGKVIGIKYKNGVDEFFEYDNQGREISHIYGKFKVIKEYDQNGLVTTKVFQDKSNSVKFTYDHRGNVTSEEWEDGYTVEHRYYFYPNKSLQKIDKLGDHPTESLEPETLLEVPEF
jgi:YD repeat-containing protein